MKLNNKGITTIEVIICFVLVVIITISMYTIISTFNERKIIESYKEEITTYKNILTKDIQDDFIKIGIDKVEYDKGSDGATTIHTLKVLLKDGTSRTLVIEQTLSLSEYHPGGFSTVDDNFMIRYGPTEDMIEYPLPDLGSYVSRSTGRTIKDLSINNVLINISDENILSIYIGFYHPDLSTRYAIDIVCPVNYIFGGAQGESDGTWDALVNN